ncbi:MAG TPA: protoglobin domain-containing protein [Rubrobacteraceae bacterium]|nr:protoglobin domain-containing protein [Rubrobacteraceae bacterium]
MTGDRGVIPGYGFGGEATARSPLRLEDLDLLKQTVLFTVEDEEYLRLAGEVLEDQTDEVLDLWYGFVGSHPHLIRYFADSDGQPDNEYLERVRERFKQWILDTCRRSYDQEWLDYQQEIALRHTRAKKNQTDGAYETPEHVPLRYMISFIYPITVTIKSFLVSKGHSSEEVEKMYDAWFKSVVLQVALWSCPYAK